MLYLVTLEERIRCPCKNKNIPEQSITSIDETIFRANTLSSLCVYLMKQKQQITHLHIPSAISYGSSPSIITFNILLDVK